MRYIESMSNFILVELGPRAEEYMRRLLEKGIIVRSGATWDMPHHIRVSVGTPEENDWFIENCRRLLGND